MGMKAGEERSLTETVGGAWWEPDGLQNVAVRSEVVLREVFEWDVPEVRILCSPRLIYTVRTCILHLQKNNLPLTVWENCVPYTWRASLSVLLCLMSGLQNGTSQTKSSPRRK